MTTDAFPKVASETVRLGRTQVTVAGIGKGAAMMAPNMATLLVFIVTDAALAAPQARSILRTAGEASFNALTVDGDTSTNDSMFLLAGGAAGNSLPAAGSPAFRTLGRATTSVAQQIARMVVADGEGSTKIVTIEVTGGRTERDARRVARAVGQSLLVKAAFHGSDPNWGRIACAIGYSGARVAPERVRIRIGEVEVFRHGEGVAGTESAARAAMGQSEFRVGIALGAGRARATLLASDLSHEYVELNSAYST
jgi:glutamate N-acetyltransferase/amino-acid N-acetyltransferase